MRKDLSIGGEIALFDYSQSRTVLVAAIAVALAAATAPACASGKLYYGSRAGMQVSVISISDLDTAHAVIRTRHTREDAIAFCRDYVLKVTPDCIRRELETPLNDQIVANCKTGEFSDFYGGHYKFAGAARSATTMAKYSIIDMSSGQEADGSSASGYPVNLSIFKALCPRTAPMDE